MKLLFNLIFCALALKHTDGFLVFLEKFRVFPVFDRKDYGEPLYLTPLIEQGKISEARSAAKVVLDDFTSIQSYAGYLTVNKQFDSNMFVWFFPSMNDYKTDPVIIWLQGGPGASSLLGLFLENGPFEYEDGDDLFLEKGFELRKYSWTQTHSVIYIDNPVGTGYSFTNEGYAANQTAVGNDLYNALVQFFKLFPELQKNDFFVAGESYGGKYVPAVAYTIYKKNPQAELKINLKGISIGNGLCDPINQLKYSDYLYQIGLIDSNAKAIVEEHETKVINYIKQKMWVEAFNEFDELLNGDFNNGLSLFRNITGFSNYFNYLVSNDTHTDLNEIAYILQQINTRKALHVGDKPFNMASKEVEQHLIPDVAQSVAPWIEELLNNYKVLVYNGQLDIIVPYPMTVNFLQKLRYDSADEYKTAKRYIWRVGSDIAGYVKTAGNLTEVLVRNAGHMVPADRPVWAFDMISRFTRNKPFY